MALLVDESNKIELLLKDEGNKIIGQHRSECLEIFSLLQCVIMGSSLLYHSLSPKEIKEPSK